jgi:hypothetical protein
MVCAMMIQALRLRPEFAGARVNAAFKPVCFWGSQLLDFPGKTPFQSLNKPVAEPLAFAIVPPNSRFQGLILT